MNRWSLTVLTAIVFALFASDLAAQPDAASVIKTTPRESFDFQYSPSMVNNAQFNSSAVFGSHSDPDACFVDPVHGYATPAPHRFLFSSATHRWRSLAEEHNTVLDPACVCDEWRDFCSCDGCCGNLGLDLFAPHRCRAESRAAIYCHRGCAAGECNCNASGKPAAKRYRLRLFTFESID